ncbi:MAG: hypothetical protein PHC61_04130 [Chitinivibrionales bacterium]|nr:hypothetical protein [Chitinivibrionales bacterium]
MKTPLPATLIQVHYHNRPGGVTTVMQAYARAFSCLQSGKIATNLLFCRDYGERALPVLDAAVVSNTRCDYRWYADKKQFLADKRKLFEALQKLIQKYLELGPVCCIGHNLTLGKNTALSGAFANVARKFANGKEQVRFISAVHDLAEAGRLECLRQINRNVAWDASFYNELYPRLKNVIFWAPGKSVVACLKRAGLSVYLMENPLEYDAGGRLKKYQTNLLRKQLFNAARSARTPFCSGRPLTLYPARVIARKNAVEAVLVSAVARSTNLVLGGPGTHAADRRAYRRLQNICRRYKLPVLFNYNIIDKKDQTGVQEVLTRLYQSCDWCLSTSLSEGFGYALYMPWLFNRPLFGRKPLDFIPPKGLNYGALYDTLLVPAPWVALRPLEKKYRTLLAGMEKKPKTIDRFCRRFRQNRTVNGRIDFGLLDQENQFRVLERLVKTPADAVFVFVKQGSRLIPIRDYPARSFPISIIKRNRRICLRQLGFESFCRRFARLLKAPVKETAVLSSGARVKIPAIPVSYIRLLITPGM